MLSGITYFLQVLVTQQLAAVTQDRESTFSFLLVLGLLCLRVHRATQTLAPLGVLQCDDLEEDTR